MIRFVIPWIAAIFGLQIGSFMNVVIWRVPRGLSLIRPGSSCPSCGRFLRWYENIPLGSFLFLRGRCSGCDSAISVQYPLIELSNMVGYFVIFLWFHGVVFAIVLALFFSTLLVISLIDVQTRKIPRKILYFVAPLILIGLTFDSIKQYGSITHLEHPLEGAFLSLVIFGAIHLAKPKAMGMGDVRLAAFIGLVLGYLSFGAVFDFIYGSFVLGAVFGIGYALFKSKTLRATIPFGPFMSMSAVVALFIYPIIRIF